MDEREREALLARFWPRLREEAHELYREAAMLRGRIRQLEREVEAVERALEHQRATNEKLRGSEAELRRRLRAIERSRGWRLLSLVRRARGRRPLPATQPPATSEASPITPARARGREPTSAQRWAAEAARRADVAARVDAWSHLARASSGRAVVLVAGDPSDEHTRMFVRSCLARGEAVCELEADLPSDGPYCAIPPGVQPSLVPDILRIDVGAKERVFVCTVAGHAAIRWFVPAQQDGWTTGLIVSHAEASPALSYLATHGDAVLVPTESDARAIQDLTGITATVLVDPSPLDLVDARRSGERALPRAVLGIE
jgi:hypothetical protein